MGRRPGGQIKGTRSAVTLPWRWTPALISLPWSFRKINVPILVSDGHHHPSRWACLQTSLAEVLLSSYLQVEGQNASPTHIHSSVGHTSHQASSSAWISQQIFLAARAYLCSSFHSLAPTTDIFSPSSQQILYGSAPMNPVGIGIDISTSGLRHRAI